MNGGRKRDEYACKEQHKGKCELHFVGPASAEILTMRGALYERKALIGRCKRTEEDHENTRKPGERPCLVSKRRGEGGKRVCLEWKTTAGLICLLICHLFF